MIAILHLIEQTVQMRGHLPDFIGGPDIAISRREITFLHTFHGVAHAFERRKNTLGKAKENRAGQGQNSAKRDHHPNVG